MLNFYSFLLTNTHYHLRKGLLRYIENLGDLHKFNWAEAILKCTMEKISHYLQRVREREDGGEAVYLIGCPAVLQMWVCEHSEIAQQRNSHEDLIYRKWADMKVFRHKSLSTLPTDEVLSITTQSDSKKYLFPGLEKVYSIMPFFSFILIYVIINITKANICIW